MEHTRYYDYIDEDNLWEICDATIDLREASRQAQETMKKLGRVDL